MILYNHTNGVRSLQGDNKCIQSNLIGDVSFDLLLTKTAYTPYEQTTKYTEEQAENLKDEKMAEAAVIEKDIITDLLSIGTLADKKDIDDLNAKLLLLEDAKK